MTTTPLASTNNRLNNIITLNKNIITLYRCTAMYEYVDIPEDIVVKATSLLDELPEKAWHKDTRPYSKGLSGRGPAMLNFGRCKK
jgi:hypothetical protein